MSWTSCAAPDLTASAEGYERWMTAALDEARLALETGDVPVGAAIVDASGEVIALGRNAREAQQDPTAHAEVLALRAAATFRRSWRLTGLTLVVTLEPCTMCAGAISLSRVRRLYYGAADPKGGAVDSGVRFFASPTCHHVPEVYSAVGESEAATLLREFFKARR
jgi:tRNA(adenine34) deaminase